jgi:hypothetical protein
MKFAILLYESPEAFADRSGDGAAAYWSTWAAYFGALSAKNATGACLKGPETGALVRVNGSSRLVEDGPYADTKEQLGGFAIIEADSLEETLAWAERCPAASRGAVEVRPVQAVSEFSEIDQ